MRINAALRAYDRVLDHLYNRLLAILGCCLFHGKAVEVVSKRYWTRIAFADLQLSLVFFSQRPQYPMRQNQVLDVGVPRDLSDDGRRHMQAPLESCCSFRDSIVGH